MIATAKNGITVHNFNIRTFTGRKSTKDRKIEEGESFVVISEFLSNGMGTHGDKCLILRDGNRRLLVQKHYFIIEE